MTHSGNLLISGRFSSMFSSAHPLAHMHTKDVSSIFLATLRAALWAVLNTSDRRALSCEQGSMSLRHRPSWSQAHFVTGPVGHRPRQSTHTHTHTQTHAQVLCCYPGLWRSGPVTNWACDQLGSPRERWVATPEAVMAGNLQQQQQKGWAGGGGGGGG